MNSNYTPISTPIKTGNDLYNGNIASWTSQNSKSDGTLETAWTQQFEYNQLNRLTKSNTYSVAGTNAYKTSYNYDPNGNILALNRYDALGTQFDQLFYNYQNVTNGYKANTNKLRSVDDGILNNTTRTDDLKDQDSDNYEYNELGQLISDDKEEIESIEWNTKGKIVSIKRKAGSTKDDISFAYDAMGRRVSKTSVLGSVSTTTYYVHDDNGKLMATYQMSTTKPNDGIVLQDQVIYGTTRLGTLSAYATNNSRIKGYKSYELTDHLSTVRTLISDLGKVRAFADYYPFGMVAKSWNDGTQYRFKPCEEFQ